MLFILLIWIYLFAASFITGYAFIRLMCRADKYKQLSYESYILAGFGVLTVYAETFSLFSKVGLWSNVLLIALLIILFFLFKKDFVEYIKQIKLVNKVQLFILIILFGLFAYGTSHGYMHYDSDLYHAQSIRWVEEYGVVKGLGNLHSRIAYNSAAFPLTALFSMKFLLGQSYHVCAGFLAWTVASMCRNLFNKKEFLRPSLKNAVRIVAIYYLAIIFDEMVSPASDYFVVLMIIATALLFLEQLEIDAEDANSFGLISLLSLMVVSYKISGALIVLIAIYPLYLLLKDKDIKSIIKFLVAGVLSVLPLLIRNVILSGYLVYPVPGIDLFDVDYKIPLSIATYDSKEIQVYGRGHIDITRFDEPISVWGKSWFNTLDGINKVAFLLSILGVLLLAVYLVNVIIKKEYKELKELFIIAVIGICFIFWLFTSPNIRFGCIFMWLFPALVLQYGYMKLLVDNRYKNLLYQLLVVLFLVYKALALGKEIAATATSEYLVKQQDYGHYEVDTFSINGNTFYVPKEGDQAGYDNFPAAPFVPYTTLISDNICDGFIATNP